MERHPRGGGEPGRRQDDLLADFAAWLRHRRLALDHQVPFYVRWGERCLRLSKARPGEERIADYATNIAEDVIYMMEGWIVRHGAGLDGEGPREG